MSRREDRTCIRVKPQSSTGHVCPHTQELSRRSRSHAAAERSFNGNVREATFADTSGARARVYRPAMTLDGELAPVATEVDVVDPSGLAARAAESQVGSARPKRGVPEPASTRPLLRLSGRAPGPKM